MPASARRRGRRRRGQRPLLVPGNLVLVLLEIIFAAAGPAQGQFHRLAGSLALGGELRALVEGHDDVGAEADFGCERALRAEEMRRAVEVRAEADAFLGDFAQLAQTKDLEAARVGQDGPLPAHEAVHAAKLANGLDPRPQIKMVGVVEQYLDAQLFESVLRNAFDVGKGADGHEHGRLDRAVRSDKAAGPGRARARLNLEGKRHLDQFSERCVFAIQPGVVQSGGEQAIT